MLSNERLLELGHQHKLIKYSFAAGDVLAFGRAVAEAAVKADREDRHTVSDSELAGRIMTLLGRATNPSLEPGADPLRDKVAQMLASST